MRLLPFFLISILSFQLTHAQNPQFQECDVTYSPDPSFDRAEYERFKSNYLSRASNEVKLIPISARIVRRSDGSGGLDPEVLGGIIDTLNVRFKSANMEFFMCGPPAFVDVNAFFDFDRSIFADSLVTYNIPNVINMYFINKILNDDVQICGYASFPWRDQEYVVVKNSCALNGSTLAHEVGHYLGLLHTHETANGIELVDGSNCLFTGDEICDTPADPRLGSSNVNGNCDYTGTQRDTNGKRYEPDPTNIMSYSRKSCRDYFSPEQNARMNFYLERDRSHLECRLATSIPPKPRLDLQAFPNPVNDLLRVELSLEKTQKISWTLMTLQGRVLNRSKVIFSEGKQYFEIPMNQLNSGMYLLNVEGIERKSYIKVVKE